MIVARDRVSDLCDAPQASETQVNPPIYSLPMTKEMNCGGRVLRLLRSSCRRSVHHRLTTRLFYTNAQRKAAVAEAKVDTAPFHPAYIQNQPIPSAQIHEIAVSADGSRLSVSVNDQPLQLDSLFLRDSCMTPSSK